MNAAVEYEVSDITKALMSAVKMVKGNKRIVLDMDEYGRSLSTVYDKQTGEIIRIDIEDNVFVLDMRPVAEAEDEEDVCMMQQKVVPEGKKKYEVYKKGEEFEQKIAGEKATGMPVDFHASQQQDSEATLIVGANPRTSSSSTAVDQNARRDVSVSVGRRSADDLQVADLFQEREREEVSTRLSVLEQSFRLQRKFEGGTAGRNKLTDRWTKGIWLGKADMSEEHLVYVEKAVRKYRTEEDCQVCQ